MRILVNHREPLLAAGVASVLRSEPDFCVLDDEACGGTVPQSPDVVVTDYETGLTLAREPRRVARWSSRACAVVVLTSRRREHDIRRAMEAGVDGYLIQGCGRGEVAGAVRTVGRGERHVCAIVAEQLAESLAREALTAREQEVLQLLAAGRCNKTIARQLLISVATVKTYVSAVLAKLGARSRVDAVRIAAARGLVNLTGVVPEFTPLHLPTAAPDIESRRPGLETRMKHIAAAIPSQSAEPSKLAASDATAYELRYRPLVGVGCGFVFPCDAKGNVALDSLSERALKNYLYARVVTGSQFGWPSVERR